MSREMSVIVLGLLVIVIPYTGFPSTWRTLFLLLVGAAIVVIGFLLRGQTLSKPQKKTEHHPFQESTARMSDVRPAEMSDTAEL